MEFSTRLLYVERHEELRTMLCKPILLEPSLTLVAACSNVQEALPVVAHEKIDVAVIGIELADMSGIEVVKAIKLSQPKCEVIIAGPILEEDLIISAITAGASGYLLRDELHEKFIESVQCIRTRGAPIHPVVSRFLVNRIQANVVAKPTTLAFAACRMDRTWGRFSDRESNILRILAKGFSIAEIAAILAISINTVKTHVRHIYRKLEVNSRTEAIYEANRIGLLSLES